MIRRLIRWLPLPLAVLATGLAGSMWLRAFPAATLAVPLFGAALLSVLLSAALVLLSRWPMRWTVPAGLAGYLCYTLLVVLRSPFGFASLGNGFLDGPAQLLSFALPLVSPRSLMVWPVALCWLAGLLAAESLTRSRLTLLPYAGWLAVFGAGYAGSSRAMGADASVARRADLALAGGLLLVLVLLRVVQSWLRQDGSSEAAELTSPDGQNSLPLQRILTGAGTAVLVVLLAGYLVGTPYFGGPPNQLKRVPSVIVADPTTPLAYVASLRPADRHDPGSALFDVSVDRPVPGYFGLASVDYYDGDSWSFTRDFRPSGGIVPADTDPDLAPALPAVTQDYRIRSQLLTRTPWLPSVFRPQKVTGVPVSVDPVSGMMVPTGQLSVGQRYQVRSVPAGQTLSELPASWLPATSAPPIDDQLPVAVRSTLTGVIASFATETGRSSSTPDGFLQAVVADLRDNYLLAQAKLPTVSAAASRPVLTGTPRGTAAKPARSAKRSGSPARTSPKPSATAGGGPAAVIGGTSFAAVLAAILGPQRTGTPEQYATLCALLARELGVPARVVSGFRITTADGGHLLGAGSHTVTTADAYTWVEIPVRGAGWVVLDPAPSRYAATDAQPSVGVTKSSTPSRTPSQAALVTESAGGHAVAPKSVLRLGRTGGQHRRWYLLPLLVLAGCLLVLLLLLAGKWLRLVRRRRLPDARLRVIAAWQETLDLLQECGLGDLHTLTGTEVSQAAGDRFGAEPAGHVAAVATVADQATFSERIPIVSEHAEDAWRAHHAARRTVRRALPLAARLLSHVRSGGPRRLTGPAARTTVGLAGRRRPAAGHRRKH